MKLQAASGFPIDGYLNNTNLLEETTPKMVREGEQMILEASKLTGIPLAATCAMKEVGVKECLAPEFFEMTRQIFYSY